MKVKAKEPGFDNLKLREKNEIFDWPGKKIPKWCELVEKAKPVDSQKKKK